ncbi:MAG TPA: hypothetical protein VFV99_30125 [Kofleriaceae bacterium]|nr:hypothetical protein [Kofleriaceae bacterium]
MSRRTVVLELAGEHQLARDLVAGGVFVPGEVLAIGEDCDLLLRGEEGELALHATCVWVDREKGSGLQLMGCDAEMKQQIATLAVGTQLEDIATSEVERVDITLDDMTDDDTEESQYEADGPSAEELAAAELEAELAGDDEEDAERKLALNVNERLRGLTLVQQLRVAQRGELSERIVLERMYGKNVWDALLRNQRLTGPEVARIARMGALPRPLIELIVGNGAWLQIPEVRRALLSNPRLATDQISRVLRLLPKHELKLASVQTAYPFAVRDAAKRMLREMSG